MTIKSDELRFYKKIETDNLINIYVITSTNIKNVASTSTSTSTSTSKSRIL
jgi:hypothetical protein